MTKSSPHLWYTDEAPAFYTSKVESGDGSGLSIACPSRTGSLRPANTCRAAQAGFHDHAVKGSNDKYVGSAQQVVAVDNG